MSDPTQTPDQLKRDLEIDRKKVKELTKELDAEDHALHPEPPVIDHTNDGGVI